MPLVSGVCVPAVGLQVIAALSTSILSIFQGRLFGSVVHACSHFTERIVHSIKCGSPAGPTHTLSFFRSAQKKVQLTAS
eukprot:2634464-Rhodomonas_salina.1